MLPLSLGGDLERPRWKSKETVIRDLAVTAAEFGVPCHRWGGGASAEESSRHAPSAIAMLIMLETNFSSSS